MQPYFELAQVLRAQWKNIEQSVANKQLNRWQLRTLSAIAKCRTQALGGHIDGCDNCGKLYAKHSFSGVNSVVEYHEDIPTK